LRTGTVIGLAAIITSAAVTSVDALRATAITPSKPTGTELILQDVPKTGPTTKRHPSFRPTGAVSHEGQR
jgi:hypothetical protein